MTCTRRLNTRVRWRREMDFELVRGGGLFNMLVESGGGKSADEGNSSGGADVWNGKWGRR